PQQFGQSVETFHQRNLARQRDWPTTLLATSTHDAKRSEDVRARMVAISEIPELWRRSLQRWGTANRRWKRMVNDLEAPDANEEYLLYQTLLGTWPIQANGEAYPTFTRELRFGTIAWSIPITGAQSITRCVGKCWKGCPA